MTQPAPTQPTPSGRVDKILHWLDERSGAGAVWNVFFARNIPLGANWLYSVGFAALFAFTIQAVTGIFLAMYYSPSPDHAYDSIQFIMYQVPFGAVVRGIHHWGASAMVAVVVLHMLITYFLGAYKYPRELNWVIGVGLLVVTLGFGFTGYLLPWDQKAYWATVVGTAIPGTLPVIGGPILAIFRGGQELGAMTLTRFYSLHMLLLPASLLLLVAPHIYLVVKHGVSVTPGLWEKARTHIPGRGRPTPQAVSKAEYHERYTEFKEQGKPFWPYNIIEDMVLSAIVLIAIFALIFSLGVQTEAPADPTDTAYVPRPEWYFMFLFQMLKYFPGSLEWVGAAVVPGVAMAVLVFLPFIDRSPWRSPRRRPIATAAAIVALIVLAYLTYAAYTS